MQDSLHAGTLEITATVNELLLDLPTVEVLQNEHEPLLITWCDCSEADNLFHSCVCDGITYLQPSISNIFLQHCSDGVHQMVDKSYLSFVFFSCCYSLLTGVYLQNILPYSSSKQTYLNP